MSDILNAKIVLAEGHSVVFVKGGSSYISDGRGISPLIGLIKNETDLTGYSVADVIVGKAAALLFVKMGIKNVYGQVISVKGKAVLEDHNIDFGYGELVDMIINRKGTGSCPMEAAVESIDDPEEAYMTLSLKVEELKGCP